MGVSQRNMKDRRRCDDYVGTFYGDTCVLGVKNKKIKISTNYAKIWASSGSGKKIVKLKLRRKKKRFYDKKKPCNNNDIIIYLPLAVVGWRVLADVDKKHLLRVGNWKIKRLSKFITIPRYDGENYTLCNLLS